METGPKSWRFSWLVGNDMGWLGDGSGTAWGRLGGGSGTARGWLGDGSGTARGRLGMARGWLENGSGTAPFAFFFFFWVTFSLLQLNSK